MDVKCFAQELHTVAASSAVTVCDCGSRFCTEQESGPRLPLSWTSPLPYSVGPSSFRACAEVLMCRKWQDRRRE